MPDTFERVCVIGLGEIGGAVFEDLASHKNKPKSLVGVDINEQVALAWRNRGYDARTDMPYHVPFDVYIITIFDSSKISQLIGDIPETGNPLIIIESTIAPKDLADLVSWIHSRDRMVITCPHRFNPRDLAHRVFNLDRILGAAKDRDMAIGVAFYEQFMSRNLIHTAPFHTAALSKVIENTYRFYEIVFAQELKRSLESHGFDFEQIRSACNTKWNIDIKEAKDGVAGKCLPKDTGFFNNYFKENTLIKVAELLNNSYIQEHLKW